jgi:hypothetical protein
MTARRDATPAEVGACLQDTAQLAREYLLTVHDKRIPRLRA